MRFNHLYIFCVLLTAFTFTGCDPNAQTSEGDQKSGFQVIATTGQINDALVALTKGTDVSIHVFCGPGVDPHSFSASANDVQLMIDADLIVYNGFHLEAKLSDPLHETYESKSWAMSSSFPEVDRLDWVEDGEIDEDAPFDPHIWNHLPGWSKCVEALAVKLGTVDPDNAAKYQSNAANYVNEILAAHEDAKAKLAQLPKERRVIVSAHDAFNYFAKQYDMETLAVLGIGNDPEADIVTMQQVAAKICQRKIPAIFMESITNPKITGALKEACEAKDWSVQLVDQPLYSDDLGESAPQNSFLGAFKSNVDIIYNSLK